MDDDSRVKVDISEYLPFFMREYLQIRLLCDVGNAVFDDAYEQLDIIDSNQYIYTADSDGLKRFEQMLGITATSDDTLESRRLRILSYWNNNDSYTYTYFLNMLDMMIGAGNYETYEYFDEYRIVLVVHSDVQGAIEELENLIDYVIPCNIEIIASNVMSQDGNESKYYAGAVSEIQIYSYSDSYAESVTDECNAGTAGAVSEIFRIENQ